MPKLRKEVNQAPLEGTFYFEKAILPLMLLPSAYSLTSLDWNELLLKEGHSLNVLPYWLDGLFKNKNSWNQHISPHFIQHYQKKFDFSLPEISQIQESLDGTFKFLMRLSDGLEVETVLIPFFKRYTVCLSTQVGCAMNCSFCYTGTQGLKRNLKSNEIIGQYQIAHQWLKSKMPHAMQPNIVFMGQGEPLHNETEVLQAIKILNDPNLIGVGHRQMTLSTVGYLPGMENLNEFPRLNFALSLHSPFDEERSLLIPINQRFPLHEIMKRIDQITLLKRQFITYEYLLIKNLNMSERHVEELTRLLSHRKAIINLIPFNPFPGSNWERPTTDETTLFKEKLVANRLRVMVRTTKGNDILAACGQLKVEKLARNNGIY